MAVYYCHNCGEYNDDDWNPGEEDPFRKNELMCPACFECLECPKCGEELAEENCYAHKCTA